MSGNKYSINPVSRGMNNFFENLTNSTNPRYIQPIQQPTYTPPPQPVYTPPSPISTTPFTPFSTPVYKMPTTIYTPPHLRTYF